MAVYRLPEAAVGVGGARGQRGGRGRISDHGGVGELRIVIVDDGASWAMFVVAVWASAEPVRPTMGT